MKLVVMQPYFLPYLGYFDLLNQTDEWIVFDTPQYMKGGWVNRNRVLSPAGGWQYIGLPVKKHALTTPINQVEVAPGVDWAGQIMRQLGCYRKRAPFYEQTVAFLSTAFDVHERNVARINESLLVSVARYLGIDTPVRTWSAMRLDLDSRPANATGWGVQIARAVGADHLLNRPGGAAFLDRDTFARAGITLEIQSFRTMEYGCIGFRFEPDLSIVDVLMWNSPAGIKQYLDTWRTRTAEMPGRTEAS